MNIFRNISLVFVCIISLNAFSQHANNWRFGNFAGLNFNTNPLTIVSTGLTNNPDNTSSISDVNGNLLFYTDGMSVWNANNAVMPNGSGLIGHGSGGQCAVIVPIPCSSKYVIFHVTEFSSPGSLNYSVVDMSLNGGLGDVISAQKNVSLGTGWTEKLCAIFNPANSSYWLLTHKWGNNQFVAYTVDATSIATQSVVSSVGSVHSCGSYGGAHDAMGQLTISRDGSKVINALTCLDQFELFNFNLATGVLSNSIVLPAEGNKAWGTSFSPDSKMLYTSSIFGQNIFQYDLNVYTAPAILASKNAVISVGTTGYNFGYMELGPNNKLYIARPGNNSLSVISSPNSFGALSNPSLVGQSIGLATSSHGLSRVAYNISVVSGTVGNLSMSSSSGNYSICPGQSLTLLGSGANSYTWSNGSNSSSITVSPLVTSNFTLFGYLGCAGSSAQTVATVFVKDAPVMSISGTSSLCSSSGATLTASGADSYLWSNGAQAASISFTPLATTVYTVIGTNAISGCTASLAYQVNVTPSPTLSLSGPTIVCVGTQVNYTASGANTYTWSMGLNGSTVSFTPVATAYYTVSATSLMGCKTSTTFFIVLNECLNNQEINESQDFRVLPNPVDDKLVLLAGKGWNGTCNSITLMDEHGKIVKVFSDSEMEGNPLGLTLNFSEIIKGVYLLTIQTEEKVFTKKIIKN